MLTRSLRRSGKAIDGRSDEAMLQKRTLLHRNSINFHVRRSLLARKALSLLLGSFLTCFVFALVSACSSSGRDPAESPSRLVPSGWKPSLEQVQTSIQDELETKTQKSQQYLNLTSQNLSDLADARLFITYIRLMQSLDGK